LWASKFCSIKANSTELKEIVIKVVYVAKDFVELNHEIRGLVI